MPDGYEKKRLVVCLDGTWNDQDSESTITNVVKIMRCVKAHDAKGNPQVTFYDAGVGTGNKLDRLMGGAFGKGLEDNVLDGYRFLANNYEPDDEIFIFGFSRGAYTARTLAGLVCKFGLMTKTNLYRVGEAWRCFKAQQDLPADLMAAQHDVRVECLGVWDTVGALGIPETVLDKVGLTSKQKKKYRFLDITLSSKVRCAFHAIAIDEKRAPFRPTLWQKKIGEELTPGRVVEQVWFPGVHSDLGGGYAEHGLSDNALRWMLRRTGEETGLELDPSHVALNMDETQPTAAMHDSLTALYLMSKMIKYDRPIMGVPFERGFFGRMRFGTPGEDEKYSDLKGGNEYHPQALHQTAADRLGQSVEVVTKLGSDGRAARTVIETYAPVNLPKDKISGIKIVP